MKTRISTKRKVGNLLPAGLADSSTHASSEHSSSMPAAPVHSFSGMQVSPTVQRYPGENDAAMATKHNTVSDVFNGIVGAGMGALGYDTSERTGADNNSFYRDNAQYMPGYNIDGIPSGAWAQNAATNHVGQGTGPGNPWDNVRRSLVSQESSMINSSLASGGDGKLSFGQVYDAHTNAYDQSKGGGNSFIDPGSFAMAVYGAPMLEAVGIDSGPITGASIDIFNNPEDSATAGWAKRMGLAAGEIGTGMAMGPLGIPLMAAGAFGAGYNTGTALTHGMLGEWGDAASSAAGYVMDKGSEAASGIAGAAGDAVDWSAQKGSEAINGVTGAAGDATSWLGNKGSEAMAGIGGFVDSAAQWDSIQDVSRGLDQGYTGARNWITNSASDVVNGVSGAAAGAADWMGNTATEAVTGVGSALGRAGDWLLGN